MIDARGAGAAMWRCDGDMSQLARDGYTTVKLDDAMAIARARDAAVAFFAEDRAHKQRWLKPPAQDEGYRACSDIKEMFMVRRAPLPLPLLPVVQAWQQCDGMCATILDQVAEHLAMLPRSLSDLLPTDPTLTTTSSASVMRLLHYQPGDAIPAQAHVDLGLLTLVPRSTHPALQLQVLDARGATWHDVERDLPPDRAVVMAGASLEWCTHQRIPAGQHRVGACRSGRYSVVYQARPHDTAIVPTSPHPSVTGAAPASMTGADLLARLRRNLASVNAADPVKLQR